MLRFTEQSGGGDGNQQADGNRNGGVKPIPTGQKDASRGEHHCARNGSISGHVQEGPASVQIALARSHEQQR